MATIKSYTDIQQSKVLAEVLPHESADMRYSPLGNNMHPWVWTDTFIEKDAIPCWSLAALFDVLPPIEGFRPIIDLDINLIRYEGNYRDELCFNGNNLVDACVIMIEKLHELNLL